MGDNVYIMLADELLRDAVTRRIGNDGINALTCSDGRTPLIGGHDGLSLIRSGVLVIDYTDEEAVSEL